MTSDESSTKKTKTKAEDLPPPTDYLTISVRSGTVTGATNATPIVITSASHGMLSPVAR